LHLSPHTLHSFPTRRSSDLQVELLRATPDELDEQIATVSLDPEFPAFLQFCRQRGADVQIVSDGFDRVIAAVLREARLDVPFFADRKSTRLNSSHRTISYAV